MKHNLLSWLMYIRQWSTIWYIESYHFSYSDSVHNPLFYKILTALLIIFTLLCYTPDLIQPN